MNNINLEYKTELMFSTDDFVAEPSASTVTSAASQAASDVQLFATVSEIDKHNYLYLYERCKAFNINARQLRYLEKEHIRRIIPPEQIGILAEFEYYHAEWKRQFKLSSTPILKTTEVEKVQSPPASIEAVLKLPKIVVEPKTVAPSKSGMKSATPTQLTRSSKRTSRAAATDSETSESSASAVNSNSKRGRKISNTEENCKHHYLLEKIIKKELKNIQTHYKINGFLIERDRRLIATALVEYFLDRSIYMSRDIMDSMAIQISQIFPTESKLAWHDTSSNRRRGRLCLKLYNSQRTKRPHGNIFRGKYDRKTQQQVSKGQKESDDDDEASIEELPIENDEDDADAIRIQDWLRNHKCEDNDELLQMWYETKTYRTKLLKQYKNSEENLTTATQVQEVLDSWPAYCFAIGSMLISIDFSHIFPNSDTKFYERWPVFNVKAVKLYKAEIRETTSLELLSQYDRMAEHLTDDSKHLIILHLFHTLMRPTRCIHPRQNGRRYTVTESQTSCYRVISSPNEMSDYNEPVPYIFIVGTLFDVQSCVLAFKNARYELSVKEAYRVCFHIFMTFKLYFPLAAMNFWTFTQSYFFDIKPEAGTNMSVVDTIINFLLTNT